MSNETKAENSGVDESEQKIRSVEERKQTARTIATSNGGTSEQNNRNSPSGRLNTADIASYFGDHSVDCDVVRIPVDQRPLVKHSDQQQQPDLHRPAVFTTFAVTSVSFVSKLRRQDFKFSLSLSPRP